ncbi:MAG: sulfotransferase [Arenicellales bacterium]
MKTPIFLFSLPRSGSTLLQKLLMSHEQIASIPEPWILLPAVYQTRLVGQLSEFNHITCRAALKDMIEHLDNGEETYYQYLAGFVMQIYSDLCKNNELYFLDKTPRYYLIIPEIARMFPDAKFIFLFRNPLQIYSSLLQTFGKNSFWHSYPYHIDLHDGQELLTNGYICFKDRSIAINYENLVTSPDVHINRLLEYLDLETPLNKSYGLVDQELDGKMGDKSAKKNIDSDSLMKWKSTFNSPVRKRIIKSYIQSLSGQLLEVQGYKKDSLLEELDKIKGGCNIVCLMDLVQYIAGIFIRKFNVNLVLSRHYRWTRKKYML